MLRVVFCAGLLAATAAWGADVLSAEANLRKTQALVEAGAAPRAALQAAERELQDARDEELLHRTLYANEVGLADVPAMLRAATGLRERASETLAEQQKLVAEGVAPAATMEKPKQELAYAERQAELAQSRAKVVEELAEMAAREADLAEQREQARAAWFEGKGTLTEQEFVYVEEKFLEQQGKPLPVSARGASAVHRSLGFDHRNRYDVALNPDQPEGRWLTALLDRLRIPYIVFRAAVAGKSTGAHIHIGLPSPRE
jgi:hypothetical protein